MRGTYEQKMPNPNEHVPRYLEKFNLTETVRCMVGFESF
jgi:hypothetical protein